MDEIYTDLDNYNDVNLVEEVCTFSANCNMSNLFTSYYLFFHH